jgi:hypothetical protein
MMGNFCTRTARKIRLLGYTPKRAMWFAGFFFTSMVVVCGMMGVLSVQPEEGYGWITGSGKSPAGPRAGSELPGFFGLRRY